MSPLEENYVSLVNVRANGVIQKQIEVFKHFKQNMEKREEMFSESKAHVILKGSAVFSNVRSNG